MTKEIEFQTLEIELCEKRIKEYSADKEEKEAEVTKNDQILNERMKDLEQKKSELDEIISETKQEEEKLRDKAKDLETKIEPRLLQSFKRIRKNSRTDWVLCMCNVTHVVVALTRFRPRDSWISVLVRK